jgi:hypothetical protein
VLTKVVLAKQKTFDAWGGIVIIIPFNPTPIYGDVNGRLLGVITYSILLLTIG